ncbi:glycosyltransferase family 2 protein [Pengzhenrongella sicca]|uniref:Glycosyltransferase family 2 protein n=1 Tax=Pengzhenrongella sicca TaxID=2819238 RepID=A0A8A4ZG27_9MICO|nr:glycosyltransferase family A protein [Pengzhenrongella sicca]QTE30235.1 glycosyltransferase family 2 protein [Pengzhenrongella sicca]
MTPRVSVVVPAFNNADYIEQTIDSVLAQTFADFELLIADHSSTDDTAILIERYAADSRVRISRTPAGGGAQRNWNCVSQAATGEYLKLVCGDDLLYPAILERQVAELDRLDAGVAMTACSRDLVDGQGRVFLRARGLNGMYGRIDGRLAVRSIVRSGTNPLGEPACVLFRRSALEAAGWWDGTNPFYIDAGTYARVLMHGDLAALHDSLAAFRVSAGQWSVRLALEQSSQAEAFHRLARELAPETVRVTDVWRGNVMARKAELQRRAAYAVLGKRMRPAVPAPEAS